ncbi:rhoptry protein [Diaporthe amygdali]|uniref:rhoptry protein n=1 Tax=Phomopsis amygdali TaxID=1214568 RepID=UPI0022FF3E6F|nr:rhoptry protein [Diaporthe amygdali]KAJ0108924.1 rhoptry protein [Diaporthe amygdali]
MAPDTRTARETRYDATEPATSAGSHDTIGHTTASFGPPKEVTVASVWSDISNMSYISPANVGFDPTAPIVPYDRPMAPTPGISDLLPSSHAPSSCDFGTPKHFSHTPVFGPSPPFVPKTRGRAAFQARCETASPSDSSLSRFLRGFSTSTSSKPAVKPVVRRSTPDACDGGVPTTRASTTNGPSTNSPIMDAPAIKNAIGAPFSRTTPPGASSRSARSQATRSPSVLSHASDHSDVSDHSQASAPSYTSRSHSAHSSVANEPTVDLPTIDLPTIDLPAVDLHTADLPPIDLQTIDLSAAPGSPNVRAISVGTTSYPTTNISTADVDSPAVASATIEEANVDAFTNWSLYAVPGNILADFVSGILKFSLLDQDGKPVFVKDYDTNTSPQQAFNSHKDVKAVHISQEETRIFVSMDQLRKEIAELQEHDEAMEREADKAHQEKARLELQLQEVRGTCRKGSSDSAIGSDSDDDIRKRAQAEKLKRMQKRLDEANTLANSQFVHINALTAERDELIKECHLAHEHKKVLNEQNQVLIKQNQAMKSEVEQAAHYFTNIENEVKHLKGENERLRQQVGQMYQQNDALRKTRKSHSDQIKNLQTELEATRGQLGDTIKDTQVLRTKNRENDTHSEQIEKLKAELEATRGQLSITAKENQVLRSKNKQAQTRSEQIQNLEAELEATRGKLGEAIKDTQVLLRKNKEIKAERDKAEDSYETLQENYTVIRRQLRDSTRENSTINSVSSTRSEVRPRRPASVQVKRTAGPSTTRTAPTTARTTPTTAPTAPTAPTSSRDPDNEEHTIRPAFDTVENMRILISTTESEMARLQEKFDEKVTESKGMHKGYSRRTWERLHEEKVALEAQIHEKSKIIYHQYDLLEGLRRQGKV